MRHRALGFRPGDGLSDDRTGQLSSDLANNDADGTLLLIYERILTPTLVPRDGPDIRSRVEQGGAGLRGEELS